MFLALTPRTGRFRLLVKGQRQTRPWGIMQLHREADVLGVHAITTIHPPRDLQQKNSGPLWAIFYICYKQMTVIKTQDTVLRKLSPKSGDRRPPLGILSVEVLWL